MFFNKKIDLSLLIVFIASQIAFSQRFLNSEIKVEVHPDEKITIHFDRPLQHWDGFGVNYVETCQTRDYSKYAQDYSGFSFASEETKNTILEMTFGKDGLRPALTKLFLDPFHEGFTKKGNDDDDPFEINLEGFDHETTTKNMRYFNRKGLEIMSSWGGDLQAITTLYGPAPWMTKQKYVLGRDIDQNEKYEIAEYMVSWAKYLKEVENIPVKYISFHNEGDAYYRWPRDGSNPGEDHRDYNMYWPPQQVVDFLKITKEVLDANDIDDVLLTPGETQTWFRFDQWGYASDIVNDTTALKNLGLITSHNFAFLEKPNSVYYGDYRSIGQDLIQKEKPNTPVWVTSTPWGEGGVSFVENIRRNIYESKASGIIPWALISGAEEWLASDNTYSDGSMKGAFLIKKDGSLTINKTYYYYKQLTRAGQPGNKVVQVVSYDPSIGSIAFTGDQKSFLVFNKSDKEKNIEITLSGLTKPTVFEVYRTSDSENYIKLEDVILENDKILYKSPINTVTTFFVKNN